MYSIRIAAALLLVGYISAAAVDVPENTTEARAPVPANATASTNATSPSSLFAQDMPRPGTVLLAGDGDTDEVEVEAQGMDMSFLISSLNGPCAGEAGRECGENLVCSTDSDLTEGVCEADTQELDARPIGVIDWLFDL